MMAEGSGATMVLDEHTAHTFNSLERMGACLSLVGVSLIFITYGLCKRLRTLSNTFILLASIANVGASIACVIGYAGIWDLQRNPDSPLCQVQGFLFEWFMQSDPWWSLAMAFNVFIVFFKGVSPDVFRGWLWLYCLVCYGLPLIPSVLFLAYRPPEKGLIYGDATLWCWISPSWNYLRIVSYYIPIWACILLSILIYCAVGYQVFHQRNQLRNITISNPGKDISTAGSSDARDDVEKNLTNRPGYYGTVTTQVHVTTDTVPSDRRSSDPSATPPSPSPTNLTTATISAGGGQSSLWSPSACTDVEIFPSHATSSTTANTICNFQTTSNITAGPDGSAAAAAAGPTSTAAARSIGTNGKSGGAGCLAGAAPSWRRFRQKLRSMDRVKLAYLRTSFIFAVSVLVTWTPSSINRVYSLIHPEEFSYGLNIAASVVLPLQGVWNAVIFFTTSWKTLRSEWRAARAGSRILRRLGLGGPRSGGGGGDGGRDGGAPNMGRSRRIRDNDVELSTRVGTLRVVPGHGFDGGSI